MSIPSREGIENKLRSQYLRLQDFGDTPPALYELMRSIVDEIFQSISVELFDLYKKIDQLESKVNELQKKDKHKNSI